MNEIDEVIDLLKEKLTKEYFNSEIRFLQTIIAKLNKYKNEFEDDGK